MLGMVDGIRNINCRMVMVENSETTMLISVYRNMLPPAARSIQTAFEVTRVSLQNDSFIKQ